MLKAKKLVRKMMVILKELLLKTTLIMSRLLLTLKMIASQINKLHLMLPLRGTRSKRSMSLKLTER